MDPIQAAMQRAKDAAAGAIANAAAGAAAAPTTGTAVAAVGAAGGAVAVPGQKLSMEQLMSAGMAVDLWIKPKEFGLQVGASAKLVQSFEAVIDMTEGTGFMVKMSIKAGNPAQYWSTYDGVTSDKGIPWSEAQAKAIALDAKARAYRSADVPMILTADIVSADGEVLAKAGQRVGYATSTTNWRAWQDFYQKVMEANAGGQRVDVKVGFLRMTNKNNNAWGIMTWEYQGIEAEAEPA
ncbi:hypothetical protein [Burkholderia pseudomallei]|uniref:hypothetical protein n=2 Tax=Burkholderia TaxID=32008 RepID=UPI00053899D0|nr:hypothetical protein [Burkholderia pseudomallei]KGX19241.1 hypothetical protein X896_741 [Burkholderia pseudomallei ABCPW 1]